MLRVNAEGECREVLVEGDHDYSDVISVSVPNKTPTHTPFSLSLTTPHARQARSGGSLQYAPSERGGLSTSKHSSFMTTASYNAMVQERLESKPSLDMQTFRNRRAAPR